MDVAWRVPDGMARDTAWGRARSVFRRMARQTGRSKAKARVISWIARLARGSTALRRARQRLFRLYVRPLVIHDGHHCRTPIRPRSDHKPLQSAHQLWEAVPDIGLRPLAAGSVARAPNPTTSAGKCQYYPKGQYRLCQFSVRVSHGALGVLDSSHPRATVYR
jgi:hypothetical protein